MSNAKEKKSNLKKWSRKWYRKAKTAINHALSFLPFVLDPSSLPVWAQADRALLKEEEELRVSLANVYHDPRLHAILFQELCQIKFPDKGEGVWVYQEYDETTYEPIDTGVIFNASIAEARKVALELIVHITDQPWYDPFSTDEMFNITPNFSTNTMGGTILPARSSD